MGKIKSGEKTKNNNNKNMNLDSWTVIKRTHGIGPQEWRKQYHVMYQHSFDAESW